MRTAVVLTFLVLGCKASPAPGSLSAKPEPTPATAKATHVLGAPITAGPVVPLTEVAKNPDAFRGKPFTTTGTVSAVCKEMGCWMEIKDDAGQAHIRMAGHSFFIPKDASGRKARVQATLVPSSSKTAGHEEDCNAEAEQQMGHPLAKVQLEASGVELL